VPDRAGRRKALVEVDAFHDRIHAEDLEPVPLRLDNGRIVADADRQPAGRRLEAFSNALDELAL
jgi:hypothetical protein